MTAVPTSRTESEFEEDQNRVRALSPNMQTLDDIFEEARKELEAEGLFDWLAQPIEPLPPEEVAAIRAELAAAALELKAAMERVARANG